MSRYKNKKDEIIEVSDEHIETAIRIKLELQHSSPSLRCNWNQHKKLMEQEGFFDSENGEGYRLLIKNEQKKRGILPESTKYVELLTDKKLESLESLIGENFVAKRDARHVINQLNKIKRDLTDNMLVVKDLKAQIPTIDFTPLKTPQKVLTGDESYEGLIALSDIHIGQLIGDLGFKTAQKRLEYFTQESLKKAKAFGIKKVKVVNLGDSIEHVYMHSTTQSFEAEFPMAEQVTKAIQVTYKFLHDLSQELDVTYIGTIAGNHDRLNGNKKENVTGDSVALIIQEMLKGMIEASGNPNLSIDETNYDMELIQTTIKGKHIAMVHGDLLRGSDDDKLRKYSSIIGEQVNILLSGHVHRFSVSSENYNRMIVTSSCLMGSNSYAKGLGYYSSAGQTFIAISETDTVPLHISMSHIF